MNLSYLSQCKQRTNVPRLGNLTLVTFYLGKNSNVNTALVRFHDPIKCNGIFMDF